MLKYILLGSAMMLAMPALAQNAPLSDQVTPTIDATAPVSPQIAPAPAPQPVPSAPASAQPQAAPNARTPAPAPADPATAAQPANGGDQVAAVVGQEFPAYDKNADGTLSKAEFSAWMLALKTASDPTVKAEDSATKTWMTQAFAQADSDKSSSVSKDELTNFLAQASKS